MSNYTTRKKINHKGAEGARRKEESALAVSFVRLRVPSWFIFFFFYQVI
jgi:cell division protein FtsB